MSNILSTSQMRGLLLLAAGIAAGLGLRWYALQPIPILPVLPAEGGASQHDQYRQPPKSIMVNAADSAAFESLPGIGPKLSSRIIKYRNSLGGCFTQLSQISQVYGLKDSTYQLILPYLVLDTCTPSGKMKHGYTQGSKKNYDHKQQPLDLNLADSVSLEALPGIGAKLAGRIIRFRNALGFYHSPDQLSEVYGFSDSLRLKALPFLYIGKDLASFPHLQINTANAETLGKHPYLGAKTAGTLVKYRSKIGRFHTIDDLRNVYGLDSNRIRKLEPYILIE